MQSETELFCALCIEDEATISIWRGDGVDLCNERHCISSDASWNHGGDTVVAFGAMCVLGENAII